MKLALSGLIAVSCMAQQAVPAAREPHHHVIYEDGRVRILDVRIEPRVGGAVVHQLASGGLYQWGTVLTWDPGRHYRQSFTMAQDPAHPSELDVRFVADSDGTLVHFAHGGWTAGNLDRRTGFRDWPFILGRFAVLADGGDPNAAS